MVLPESEFDEALKYLSKVTRKRKEWLMRPFLCIGKATTLNGRAGTNKSTVILDIAARLTRGDSLPGDPRPQRPRKVLLLNSEDDPEDTIAPRLDKLGADCTKIALLESVYDLGRDLQLIKDAVGDNEKEEWGLVIIDPIMDYLGRADGNSSGDVRRILRPLAKWARKVRVAVVLVNHFNKRGDGPAQDRTMGSGAFNQVARGAWAVVKDPFQKDRRLLLPIKVNIGGDSVGLAFSIHYKSDDDEPGVTWESQPVTMSIDDVLQVDQRSASKPESRQHHAENYLKMILRDGKPRPAKQSEIDAEALGISKRTLDRARKSVRVVAYQEGGQWWWRPAVLEIENQASEPWRPGVLTDEDQENQEELDCSEDQDARAPDCQEPEFDTQDEMSDLDWTEEELQDARTPECHEAGACDYFGNRDTVADASEYDPFQ